MYAQVLDHQDNVARRPVDQRRQEFDEAVGVDAAVDDPEGRFSGANRRDHGVFVPAVRGRQHRRLAFEAWPRTQLTSSFTAVSSPK